MEGKFYLGKLLENGQLDGPVFYKASHLTTHAIVFGMTGSGKTGLCVDLLEEAIDEGIPVVAIDPKGDVSNLALVFDELTPEKFLPWVSPEEVGNRSGASSSSQRKITSQNLYPGLYCRRAHKYSDRV